jgi:hypothetical protein
MTCSMSGFDSESDESDKSDESDCSKKGLTTVVLNPQGHAVTALCMSPCRYRVA